MKTLDVGNYDIDVVSENKTVNGKFNVAAPELNEYGFYYNQPYTAYVQVFGGKTVFFMREDGTMDVLVLDNGYSEVCVYTANGNNLTINAAAGTFTGISNNNGIYCNELITTFILGDESIVADNDFLYMYKADLGGYEVTAIDKTKASYGAIKTGINGFDTVALGRLMFASLSDGAGNKNMVIAPKIPDTVTIIGDGAFVDCTNLTKVVIPESVTTIGQEAFSYCSYLESINIPYSLTDIGDYAFYKCIRLTGIYITNVESWLTTHAEYFSSVAVNRYFVDENRNEVTELVISNVDSIPDKAFEGSGLTSVTISDSVTSIGRDAFSECASLTSVVIPDSVTSIGSYAFSICSSLKDVVIPDSVTSIGYQAFAYCTSLTSITFEGTIAQWTSISKGNYWNSDVPATHVRCIDGDVAL